MLRYGKISEKALNKSGEKLGICAVIVKNFIQSWFKNVGKLNFGNILWKKSEKVYTDELFNFICNMLSFPCFTQTPITTIDLKKYIK